MRVLAIQRSGMVPASLGRYRAIQDLGVDIGLVCASKWPEGGVLAQASDAKASFPVYGVPTFLTGKGPYYVFLPGLAGAVKHFKPDLIHFREEVFTVAGGQFQLERKLRYSDVPFIFESWQNIRKRYPWPASWFEQLGYRHAIGAIAGVPTVEPVLRAGGFKGPIEVVPLGGIDPELFSPDGPDLRKQLGGRSRLVGYVGRLAPEKGVEDLILATQQLGPGVRVILVGDGPQRKELESLARRAAVDVVFLGPMQQRELPAVLRSLDVLVLPSRTTASWKEQWGRVLTEAMACGTPVIGSDSAEVPYVIADAGLLFPEGSAGDLAEALKQMLEDPQQAARLATAGLVRAREFTWEGLAAKIHAFYKDLLSQQ